MSICHLGAAIGVLVCLSAARPGCPAAELPGKDSSVYAEYSFDDFPGNKNLENLWQHGPGRYAEGVRVSRNPGDRAPLFDDPTLAGRVLRLSIPTFPVDGTAECFVHPDPGQPGSASVLSTGSAGNSVLTLSIKGKSLIPHASMATRRGYVEVTSETPLKPNAWSHVAVAWSSTTPMPVLRLFVNGTLTGSVANDVTPWNTEPNVLWVGSRPYWDNKEVWYSDLNFVGRIDDLRFSKKPRTEEQISEYLKKYYPFVLAAP